MESNLDNLVERADHSIEKKWLPNVRLVRSLQIKKNEWEFNIAVPWVRAANIARGHPAGRILDLFDVTN